MLLKHTFISKSHIKVGYHLGDIVVGDTGDINQPQCHMCKKTKKNL